MTNLKGKIAVVAGSSSGIGKRTAIELAHRGATVICTARRRDRIVETVEEIKFYGGIGEEYVCDFSDNESVVGLSKDVASRHGRIDIWVNGVGVNNSMGTGWEIDYSNWIADFEGNFKTCYIGTMAAIKIMNKQNSGRIINMAGGGVMRPELYNSAYSSAKTALVRFTECIALELTKEKSDIKIFSFNPGLVRTERTINLVSKPETAQFMPAIIDPIKNNDATPIDLPAKNIALIAGGMLDGLHGCLIVGNDENLSALSSKTEEIATQSRFKLVFNL